MSIASVIQCCKGVNYVTGFTTRALFDADPVLTAPVASLMFKLDDFKIRSSFF
jgi:hypothetical protein